MSSPNLTPVQVEISSKASTEAAPASGKHTTDVVYQECRLYVEGVQVPFESMVVNQAMGQLPTAEIVVPPQSGLLDICRYYEPKVHIFYRDLNLGGFRLLFWGHIVQGSYSHSRAGSGSASIRFSAVHKNALLRQLTLDYSGYLVTQDRGAPGEGGTLTVNALNSQQSIVMALSGITGLQSDEKDLLAPNNKQVSSADVTKLDKSYEEMLSRYIGMPSVSMNLWNQMKQAVYQNPKFNTVMSGMLIPMVENGIGFFKRMTGHTYLESLVDKSRQQACLVGGNARNLIIPPCMKLNLASAVQAKMSIEVISNSIQFSSELTDFYSLMEQFYYSVNYEIITLASPAEVPVDPNVAYTDGEPNGADMMAVETIVKPQLPFYYAPACNVIYPRMFSSVHVTQDEGSIPTRVTATHDSYPGGTGTPGANYRGPHTIREAVAIAASSTSDGKSSSVPDLQNTLSLSYNAPGRYEQGRGIKHMSIGIPWWLQLMVKDQNSSASGDNSSAYPEKGSDEYKQLLSLTAAWQSRYGYDMTEVDGQIKLVRNPQKDLLNPYSQKSGVLPHQSLLFTSVDYEFTKKLMGARTGMVDCVFNPYIVPGYPMDVLDDSPNHPCFHALCSSVTHSISARGINTSVGMMAVQTYAELSNYYVPPAPPWMQTSLNIVSTEGDGGADYGDTTDVKVLNAGSILANPAAVKTADQYYRTTLGVRAADPSTLMDWTTGQILPQARINEGTSVASKSPIPTPNGGDANDYNTTVGNLRLVRRPIETLESIEYKFDYKFIDMNPQNYNASAKVANPNPKLAQDNFMEPGGSLFLDYMETKDFVQRTNFAADVAEVTNTSGATEATYVSRRYDVN